MTIKVFLMCCFCWIVLHVATCRAQQVDYQESLRNIDIASSSFYSGIKKQLAAVREKKTLIEHRNKRVMEISELTSAYGEVQDLIKVEERFGNQATLNARKTKLYNLGNLINSLMEEVDMIDMYCQKRIGPDCTIPTCFGKYHQGSLFNEPCNRHGRCVDVDKCQCNAGYHGEECQIFECFGVPANESLICSGNGRCWSMNICRCNHGFSGENCETAVSTNMKVTLINQVFEPLSVGFIPKSCKEYYDLSDGNSLLDGLYKVQPYSTNEASIVTYCNMKEGGYTLIDEKILKSEQIEAIMKLIQEVKTSYGTRCVIGHSFIDQNIHSDRIFQTLCHNVGGRHNFRHKLIDILYVSPFKYWAK